MTEQTILWSGVSGTKYKYWIYTIDTTFKDVPGNYIYVKETSKGYWSPIYIGETDSLKERLSNHEKMPCVKRHGGKHIHTHSSASNEEVRRAEEIDLISKWDPPCNNE